MATEFTPEEIQRIFAEYNDAIKTGTPVTKELADRFRDAEKGMKGFSDEMRKTSQALGKSSVDFTKAMYQGAQGATAMNSAVDTLTTALQVVILLLPGARLLKVALTALTLGIGAATKAINAQSDALFKSYQDMAKFGASGAGGMRDVFDNMQKFGYGIAELDKMTALVKENSEALASFGGTAIRGTQAFADAATQIQRSNIGRELQMLGKLPDDINRGMALFIKQQQQSGMSNSQINQNLAQRSAEYIKNLDILSKLTGQDAETLQKKLDDAMAEDAFNQTIYELKQQGAEGLRQATELENAARRLTGENQKEFVRGVGGDVSAMLKSMMMSPEAVGMLTDLPNFTADAYIDAQKEGADRLRDGMGSLFKFNAMQDVSFGAKELSLIQSRNADQTAKQQSDLAKAAQELQQKGLDPATKAQVELRIEQMKARDNLQSFVNFGVLPATVAMQGLAQAATGVSTLLPGKAGGGKPMGGGGGNLGGSLGATAAGAAAGAIGGSFFGPLGTVIGGVGGGILGAMGYGGFGGGAPADLKVKPGAENKGKSTDILYGVANEVHKMLGGDYKYFSGFNDRSGGKHGEGKAFDLVLNDRARYQSVLAQIQGLAGVSFAQFEPTGFVNKNGSISSGDHIHTEVSAAEGAILSGPMSGYRPNLTMHGTEAIVPLNSASGAQALGASAMNDQMLSIFSARLEEMTRKISDVADYTRKTAQYAGA